MAALGPLPPTSPPSGFPSTACPSCGTRVPISFPAHALTPEEAHSRILELEQQVRLLNNKAAAAADKLADYEDEVRFLRAVHLRSQQQKDGNPSGFASPPPEGSAQHTPEDGSRKPQPQLGSRLSSFSAFLPGRKNVQSPQIGGLQSPGLPPPGGFGAQQNTSSTPNLLGHSSPSQAPSLSDNFELSNALAQEKKRREAAETTLSNSQKELEELTAQLFSQANEMVATERRARARLEERVEVLERRDGEKRRRLERLERAIERVERVRGMVG